jgi:dTDP-4-amino-4,6-dideoxygalactose transaminase
MSAATTERPIPLLDLAALHRPLADELRQTFDRVLTSGQFILGAEHDAFERELAAACGIAHAVGLSSGTSAISVGLQALGVEAGDEVVVPAFTYFATASAVVHAGATPVFADVEPARFGLDAASLDAAITPKTKAVVPVHLYGLACDLAPIVAVAARRGIPVLEDAAQAIGATDAGALLTERDDFAARTRLLRVHGDAGDYRHTALGTNARLDGLQAALLRVKLRHLAAWTEARRANAAHYRETLAGAPVQLPIEPAGARHTYHQYTIRAPRRDDLQRHLKSLGIASRVYYPIPVPSQPCFGGAAAVGRFPISDQLAAEVLSLPVGPELTTESIERIAAAVRGFYDGGGAS